MMLPLCRAKWRRRLHPELPAGHLLSCLTAGVFLGILNVTFATSFAALIFSGTLATYVAWGIGFTLFGAFIVGTVVALTSSYPGMIAAPQEIPVAILAFAAISITSGMADSMEAERAFVTVIVTMALTSLFTGSFFWLLGRFRLGNLIRFIPYAVISGFLAGSGWLVVQGAIGVMTETPFSVMQLPALLQPHLLIKWLPSLIFAGLLLVAVRCFTHFLIVPALLLVALGLFYLILLGTNTSIAEASARGWLLGPFPQGGLWYPLTFSPLRQVNWALILGQSGNVVAILMISVISLLLNASGLELTVRNDIDLNQELKSAGIANILSGFVGGPVGYQTLSDTALGHSMGTNSRLVGLTSAAVCAVALLFGASLLSYFPKPIAGCALLFLGLSFLTEWLYDAWFKLPKSEYILVIMILIVVGTFGFLEGISVGVLIAIVLFVVNYSRIDVVKHKLSGVNCQSNVDRALPQKRLLQAHGEELYILKLQGFIFFGTANTLVEQIRQRATDPTLPPLRFVILDFRLISGLDSSALHSFEKTQRLADAQNFTLILVHLSPRLRRQFEDNGYFIFADLDHGIEYCEEHILVAASGDQTQKKYTLQGRLSEALPEPHKMASMLNYFERQDVRAGCYVIRQGDPPRGLYFIESGQLTAELEQEDGKVIRLRRMGAGTVVGEVGLYVGSPASASVVTNQPSTIYYLSVDSLKRMEQIAPELAAAFHKFIACVLGERLVDQTAALQALLE
jgi:SulP family sulfate permease